LGTGRVERVLVRGVEWRALAEFARQYPGISFDFDLTPRLVDLVAEPFDVAIRMGNPPNSNLIARRLANLACYLYSWLAEPRSADSARPKTILVAGFYLP